MPITLEQAKKYVSDALQRSVIDEFRKNNFLLNNLEFDDAASPVGGGNAWTYSYSRLKTQPTAQFRDFNTEYTPQEVEIERFSVDLKVFGGAFEIDRQFASRSNVSRVAVQLSQKIKAAQALFNDTVINGDSSVDSTAFDGLEKALAGSDTIVTPASPVDLSSYSAIKSNAGDFLMLMDSFLAKLDGKPSALLMNGSLKAKLTACAREFGIYTNRADEFGSQIETYNGIPMIDLGSKPGSNNDVIATDPASKQTSLFAVRFGLDGFHAVGKPNCPIIQTWLPDFKTAGAVKKGEVEMVAAVALKATRAAGVLRGLKIA